MHNDEIYFRRLDRADARESFLEKEMLDSDVHHLEVRTGFFDKLAVLAGGSLALGITFLASGYQNDLLRHGIRPILCWLSLALFLVLCSLILCVVHNLLISQAVTLLSKQVECTYKAAHESREYLEQNLGLERSPRLPTAVIEKIKMHDKAAEELRTQKEHKVKLVTGVGVVAVSLLIFGFVVGLTEVAILFAYTK